MKIASKARLLRAALLASAAGTVLSAAPAFADILNDTAPTSTGAHLDVTQVELDPQIVISNPGTPTTARDPNDITGVGQMIIDQQNGYIGLCTATLINPRTVVFAAHCVNERDATAYGAANGGTPIGFGFSSYTLAGIRSWYLSGPAQYQTNTDLAFYNSNYVAYNPHSLEPDAGSFRYGDVAVAALDTAAGDIPTWALLFSQLPAVDATDGGTGYHVAIEGYGNNGTATTGSTGGIDYRRRVAENMLGALASLDYFETFLFGETPGLPQNLYWIDFDDPLRGTAQASMFDFNAWNDAATPNEGITASGDSGGPLILDEEYDIPVVIGVLSGGYTRFFNGQPANGYGTASFYQPLYLYWDWIAANNPYHYVSALAGDGAWEDASHWVSDLDPNYMILDSEGNLINGVPTTPGEQNEGTDGAFGEMCWQLGGDDECYDIATGQYLTDGEPVNDMGTASSDTLGNDSATVDASSIGGEESSTEEPQAPEPTSTLPDPTIDNGLPGATDFVPNNDEGTPADGIKPKYFDVTLSEAGTTTLSSTVEIDRLTISSGYAELIVNSGASLTSNIDITQWTGSVQVDGTLSTPGDFLMVTGGLTGTGTINADYFVSMAGVIAPGTPSTIGTLSFNGNVLLASGTALLFDIGSNGASDQIVVGATEYGSTEPVPGSQTPTALVPLNGIAAVGGTVYFIPTQGTILRNGDTFTLVSAEGGVDTEEVFTLGTTAFTAMLTPTLIYTPNEVLMQIVAGEFADVVDPTSPVQSAYAQLLDQNREQSDNYADMYTELDMMDAGSIQATLDGMMPSAQTFDGVMGTVALQTIMDFHRNRLNSMDLGSVGGTLTYAGSPVQLAANFTNPMLAGNRVMSDTSDLVIEEGALPDTMSAFVAGGYIDGNSASTSAFAGPRDDFDGWFAAAGIESLVGDNAVLGLSLAYTSISGNNSSYAYDGDSKLYQGTLYGKVDFANGITLDGIMSAGLFDVSHKRYVSIGTTDYTLRSNQDAFTFSAELGLGYAIPAGNIDITPRASLRYALVDFSPTTETGGAPALMYDLGDYEALQSRVGATLTAKGSAVRPYITINYVHDFDDRPGSFGANFVGGIGPNALFALNGTDKNWGEVSSGVTYSTGAFDISVAAQTSFERSDVETQTYQGSLTYRF